MKAHSILAWSPLVFFICGFGATAEPGSQLEFTKLAPFNTRSHPAWSSVLRDIVNHEAPGDSNFIDDKVTLAHEIAHGTQAHIRQHLNPTGQRVNGFYVLEDRAVILQEPNIRKSQIARFVPESLRGSRFQDYIVEQTSWDDTPLYVFDEWNSYVNGAEVAVDLVEEFLWTQGWRDAMMGPLEFNVYAIATAMAVKKFDPDYFTRHSQFSEFLAWNLRRSMAIYSIGANLIPFRWDRQDAYLARFRSSSDAESLRIFVRATFGMEWAKSVLGF